MKYIISFSLMALILITTTSQVKQTRTKPIINDSTAYISLRDIQSFNDFLRKAASYDQYLKLTPEATLTELWNWKLKQLADTTKKK